MAKTKKATKSAAKKTKNTRVNSRVTSEDDIVQLILRDHKTLKKLIKIMKDDDAEITDRSEAFETFAPLLTAHAKPEEQTLYEYMKDEDQLRELGFEGDVEHGLADQMVEEAKRTDDDDLWCARVKVLAELVEHHIEEEESEMLPKFKKSADTDERRELGEDFIQLKAQIEDQGSDDAPSEGTLDEMPRYRSA